VDFQQRLEEYGFTEKLVFSDKARFHMCGKVNCHNVRIWDMGNPHATVEHVHYSPKVDVFLPFPLAKSMDHFSLRNRYPYLDMLQLWLMLKL
jgi:hypothetical protein